MQDQGQGAERPLLRTVNAAEAQTNDRKQCGVLSNACGPGHEPAEANVVYIHIWKLNQDLLLVDKKALRGRCGVVGGGRGLVIPTKKTLLGWEEPEEE